MIFEVRPEYIKRIMDRGKLNGNRCTFELACVLKYLKENNREDAEAQRVISKLLDSIYSQREVENRKCQIRLSTKMSEFLPPIRTDSIFVHNKALSLISEIEDIETEHFVFYALCAKLYVGENTPVLLSQVKKGMGIHGDKKIIAFLKKTDLFTLGIAEGGKGVVEISPRLTEFSDENGIIIGNFLNLRYYYDNFKGNGIYNRCQRCGCLVKQNKYMNRKYCKSCAELRTLCQHSSGVCKYVWDFGFQN